MTKAVPQQKMYEKDTVQRLAVSEKRRNTMLDLRFVRENPEIVKQNIRNKFQDNKLPLVDEVIALDEESRKVKKEADDLRANRNKISKQIGMLMGQGKKEEAENSASSFHFGFQPRGRTVSPNSPLTIWPTAL